MDRPGDKQKKTKEREKVLEFGYRDQEKRNKKLCELEDLQKFKATNCDRNAQRRYGIYSPLMRPDSRKNKEDGARQRCDKGNVKGMMVCFECLTYTHSQTQ